MVGKIILWVLLGLLALLAAALLIPVKVRGSYEDGNPSLYVRYGPVKIQLFPQKEKPEEGEKKPPKKKKTKPEKPKKPKAKINMEQILKFYVLVAGADPAAAAMLYGRMEAALAAGFPILERALRLKDADVRLYVDFTERQMDFIADVGVSLRPWSLVWMALRAGGSLLKWYLGFRKLASPPPPESDKEQTDQKDEAECAA